ncbi:hypothetical protein NECAME_07524 [Necator americanus]|uniref:7TM GPCR serpentine receptor class x (Srx) domain-containing protein n=1 Tax=Necator americanus TaxID=51031 RepID=W2TNB4_NECAM|nr:hypothetical protein NECAME_07524 [Necator americanus]ETN83164.1 hypothetical protein NECAME_07524 [Necator americanus]
MVDSATIFCGLTYSILSGFLLPFYLILTYVMVTNTRITKMVSNRIVIQLNIADCVQLVLHFISGCLVLFPKIIEKDRVFVRIIGATINASWLVTFPILCLLAFARILIIFKYVSPLQMHFGLKIANTVALLMGGCVLVLGIAGLHFTFTDLRWEYDIHAPFVNVVRNMELYAFTPCILLSYFAYAGVTLHIRAVRGMAQNSVLPRYETHIFLHYFVVCTFMIALVLTWNISAIFEVSSRLQDFVTNCCWIICCYINAIAVMTFNRTTRKTVWSFLTGRNVSWFAGVGSTMVSRPRNNPMT